MKTEEGLGTKYVGIQIDSRLATPNKPFSWEILIAIFKIKRHCTSFSRKKKIAINRKH